MRPTSFTKTLALFPLLASLGLSLSTGCGPRDGEYLPPQPRSLPPRALPPRSLPAHALPPSGDPRTPPASFQPHSASVCSPPSGYVPPSPKLANGSACAYATQCQGGVCAAGLCTEPGNVMGCAQKFGAGFHGVLTSSCAGSDAYPICLGPSTASPPDACNGGNSCCDIGSPCSDHAQCCSGTCYALPGKASGTCANNSTHYAETCPFAHAIKIYSKTDPVSYCVPQPEACAGSGCKILEAVTTLGSSCFRRASGDVYCWGRNDKKQLGDGTTVNRAFAPWFPVKGLSDAVQLTANNMELCAVRATGQVLCWGDGQDPHPAGLDGVAQLAKGFDHSCAVTKAGTVLCWGNNDFGQLGTGTNASSPSPVLALGLSGARKVTVGFRHSCALRNDGHVLCWGAGNKLGNGGTGNSFVPVEVTGITDAVDLASANGSCAVLRSGTLTCWRTMPAQIVGGTGMKHVTADWSPLNLPELDGEPQTLSHVCGVRNNGSVACWLWGVGAPPPSSQTEQIEAFDGPGQPLMSRPLTGVASFSQRYWSACAVKESGEVLCGDPVFKDGGPGFKSVLGTRPLP